MSVEPTIPGTVILLVESGSRIFDMHHDQSDHDRHGIFVAPTPDVLGLNGLSTETVAFADEAGDVVMHEIGKYLRLALAGNPTLLNVLWVPDEMVYRISPEGHALRQLRSAFLHRRALNAFVGYAKQQLKLFLRGSNVHTSGGRPSGKWAAHLLRLLWQGRHLALTGDMILRFDDAKTAELRAIRFGTIPSDLVERAHAAIAEIEAVVADKMPTVLPDTPDTARANAFLLGVRARHWPEWPTLTASADSP